MKELDCLALQTPEGAAIARACEWPQMSEQLERGAHRQTEVKRRRVCSRPQRENICRGRRASAAAPLMFESAGQTEL